MEIVVAGFLAYALIKFLGYSAFSKYLNHLYSKQNNIWKVGLVRTLIGAAIGALYTAFGTDFISPFNSFTTGILLLILLRIFEWGAIIHIFYDNLLQQKKKAAKGISLGIIWSFILDIPIFLGIISNVRIC